MLVLVAVLALLALVLSLAAGPVVKTAVNGAGPAMLGVPVSLEGVSIALRKGDLQLRSLTVGNPEGFKSAHLLKLDQLRVAMDTGSLMGDVVRIREVIIDGPDINYEMSLTGSNLGKLIDSLDAGDNEGEKKTETVDEDAKKVEIDLLVIKNGRIRVTSRMLQGMGVPMPLPAIEMRNIGREDQTTVTDVVRMVFVRLLKSVGDVVKTSGSAVGGGANRLLGSVFGRKPAADIGSETNGTASVEGEE